MRIAVTGATGFVGTHLVRALLSANHEIRALSRRVGDYNGLERVSVCPLDLRSSTGSLGVFQDCNAAVHLAGVFAESRDSRFDHVIREGTEALVAEALRSGTKRFIYVSACGASSNSGSKFLRAKAAAEDGVRKSDLDWTILRPSAIFGPGDHLINRLAALLWLPLMPIVGDGETPLSPIHVDDVILGILHCLGDATTIGEVRELRGPKTMPFHSVVDAVENVSPTFRRPRVHLSPRLVRLMARFLAVFPGRLITREQVSLFTDPPDWQPVEEGGASMTHLTAGTIREYLHPAGKRRRVPRAAQHGVPDEETVARLIGAAAGSHLLGEGQDARRRHSASTYPGVASRDKA